MQLKELQHFYLSMRPHHQTAEEWAGVFYWLSEAFSGYDRMGVSLNSQKELDKDTLDRYKEAIARLSDGEPIQYVIGKAYFCDMWLKVDRHTLIPRPETEELVRYIAGQTDTSARILDIGTGSGCIAIGLASLLKDSSVTALDVSESALNVARSNAADHNLQIEWLSLDIFSAVPPGKFDIVVSNPPYVTRSESDRMRPNVLDHEPHLALFVPDSDPLVYYRRIAEVAKELLVPGGMLYFEINEYLGNEVVSLLGESGYNRVRLQKDFLGKDRFAECSIHE